MMKVSLSAIVLLILLAARVPGTAQGKAVHSAEQMQFSAEDSGVKRPITIPDDVLAILRQDKLVRNVLENEETPVAKLPSSWFSASEVHLSNSTETDLIIVAEGPLAGANVDVFWVFVPAVHGHDLVLTAPAHDLIVRKARWKGYREIEMSGETAVEFSSVLFRWDGRKYVVCREKSEHIR
jgi:hypothetical protein